MKEKEACERKLEEKNGSLDVFGGLSTRIKNI